MQPDTGKIVPLQNIPPAERDKWIKWEIGEQVELKGCIFEIVRVKMLRSELYLKYVCRLNKDVVMTPAQLDNFMTEITERMAEMAHIKWMEITKKEKGLVNPKDCPDKVLHHPEYPNFPCPYCHPCMVPYAELPDAEKELDRAYPAIFFKILDEMGYKVVKK